MVKQAAIISVISLIGFAGGFSVSMAQALPPGGTQISVATVAPTSQLGSVNLSQCLGASVVLTPDQSATMQIMLNNFYDLSTRDLMCSSFAQVWSCSPTFFAQMLDQVHAVQLGQPIQVLPAPVCGSVTYVAPVVAPTPTPAPTPPPSTSIYRTSRIQVSDQVHVLANLNVRDAPSLTGNVLGVAPTYTYGTINNGPVTADGYDWWDVTYDNGLSGWSAENWLAVGTLIQ